MRIEPKARLTGLKELPSGWQIKRLDDLFEVLDSLRRPLNSEERQEIRGEIPYYGANGIVDHIDRWIFDEPLLLIAEDGGYFDEYATRPIAYLIKGKSWVNNHAHVLRIRNGANLDFFHHALRNRDIRAFINGSTRTKLNQDDLRSILVPVPISIEQKKIAAILNSVDGAIAATQAVIDQTIRSKTALLQDLFTKGLPGRHSEFQTHRWFGRIPKEWQIRSLDDFSQFVTSGSRGWAQFYSENGAVFLRIGNLTRESIKLQCENLVFVSPPDTAEGRRTRVKPKDLLISITADLGVIGLVPENLGEAYVNQHIALVRLKKKLINPEWVAQFLAHQIGQSQFRRLNDPGAKAGLNLQNIRSLKFAMPERDEQDSIVTLINSVESRITNSKTIRRGLQEVKTALSQGLLSGQIRVKV